jgi:hypothetical protein
VLNEAAQVAITVTPIGPTYYEGPEDGTQVPLDASEQSDLSFNLYDSTFGLIDSVNATGLGEAETLTVPTLDPGTHYIRIMGQHNATQFYQLDVTAGTTTTPGDFDDDGDLDIDDVDALVTLGDLTVGLLAPPADPKFDLSGDGDVDVGDLAEWLSAAAIDNGYASAYQAADTDLDRDVDIIDFNHLATNFDPIGVNAATNGLSAGNADGDNDVDISDFNILASTFAPVGYDGGPAPGGAVARLLAEVEPGDVDLVVDLATGEIALDGDITAISGLQILSAGGSLLVPGADAMSLEFVIASDARTYAEGAFGNVPVEGLISLGILYDLEVDARDLAFAYTILDRPMFTGDVIYVPAPASLTLLGVGVVLLVRRCRVA